MKRQWKIGFVALVLCLATGLLVTGCGSQAEQGEADERSTGELTGQRVSLEFDDYSTAGYMWKLTEEGKGDFVIESNEITAAESGEAGAPGIDRYVLVANKPGDVELIFTLEQDWTGGDTAFEARYTFKIKDDKTVEFKKKEGKPLGKYANDEFAPLEDPVLE